MRDGRTRKVERAPHDESFADYQTHYRATLVVLSGALAGSEYALERSATSLGRGPGVDCAFDDSTMSREHAAFEFSNGCFRVRDLGSMNGLFVNGGEVRASELKHGDRVKIGEHTFQFVVDDVEKPPRAYDVSDV